MTKDEQAALDALVERAAKRHEERLREEREQEAQETERLRQGYMRRTGRTEYKP